MKIWGDTICIHDFKMSFTHKMLPGGLFKLPMYLFIRAVEQELVSPLRIMFPVSAEGLALRHE